jgi:DNA-binding MarR family transcriptional regulator
MPDTNAATELNGLYFRLFNEIGIINQLSRAAFEARLPDGMVLPQFAVINHLIRVQDGRTPLQLARAFQVPKTSMTHTLAGLEKRGLVEMRPNPDDARSKQVWLTEAAHRFRDDAIASLAPHVATFSDTLDRQELTEVIALLERLRKRMDAARD